MVLIIFLVRPLRFSQHWFTCYSISCWGTKYGQMRSGWPFADPILGLSHPFLRSLHHWICLCCSHPSRHSSRGAFELCVELQSVVSLIMLMFPCLNSNDGNQLPARGAGGETPWRPARFSKVVNLQSLKYWSLCEAMCSQLLDLDFRNRPVTFVWGPFSAGSTLVLLSVQCWGRIVVGMGDKVERDWEC